MACQLEDGASPNLISNLQRFLNDETGSDWKIDLTNSKAETVKETQERQRQERIADAMQDGFISELMSRFPGAEILDVVPSEQDEALNPEKIVHVDFSTPTKTRKESR